MPGRPRRSTALLDAPDTMSLDELETAAQDVKPASTRGRPRKSTSSRATGRPPGRRPGTVSINARGSDGKIMSEAAMKAKVAGELGMLLALPVAGLEMRDPEMAACITDPVRIPGRGDVDPIETFIDSFVNVLARNKKALAYAAKGDGITEIATALYLAFTVAKRAYQVSAARRADGYEPQGAGLSDDQYPAYTG